MSQVRNEIKFGTDGWRAVISDTFTFKNVRVVSQAIAQWVHTDLKAIKGQPKRVAVGYDCRFLSEEYAQTVAEVLAANNIEVLLSDTALPTPALSLGTVQHKCLAGIMITASHNPAKFNGIKIKTAQGGAASKDVTNKVEGYLSEDGIKVMALSEATAKKKVTIHDFKKNYVSFIRDYVDLKKFKNSKFKIIQDVMHGSGRDLLAHILKGTGIDVTLYREDVNPSFDGTKPEPVAEYLPGLLKRMKNEDFDLGLVLDGDADRVAAAAPGGIFINPQKILGLLILHLVRNRGIQGGVVKTLCGTTMIDHIAKKLDLKLYETPVGFKYISDLMVSEKIVAGGEEAGGMGLPNYIPERDGTLAGLLLLEMMVYEKKNIKQLLDDMEKEFGRYFYERSDLSIDTKTVKVNKLKAIKDLMGQKVVEIKDFDGVKLICEDESWLMFRPSGTEPLVRIYSEAKSLKKAKALTQLGEDILKERV